MPITLAARSRTRNPSISSTLRSWVRILLSAFMLVRVLPVFMVSCVGRNLAMDRSHVQGVLPIVTNDLSYFQELLNCKRPDDLTHKHEEIDEEGEMK
jgi:hypothetical protein